MQTLHQESETRPRAERTIGHGTVPSHPILRGLSADQSADQALAYAKEVQVLRQRVAALELELAASKVASSEAVAPASEFEAPTSPAVSAATLDTTVRASGDAATSAVEPDDAAEPVAPHGDPGFAEAWSNEKDHSSFEERIAERAFFRATTVDEESRSWLLSD